MILKSNKYFCDQDDMIQEWIAQYSVIIARLNSALRVERYDHEQEIMRLKEKIETLEEQARQHEDH